MPVLWSRGAAPFGGNALYWWRPLLLKGSMTPEELNRTIEFIIQSQARLAAAQEQDRIDRLQSEKERLQSEKELKAFDRRLAGLLDVQVRLLESQTRRLDEYEKESRAAQRRHEELQRAGQKQHEEFLVLMGGIRVSLDRILEKLTDRMN